MDDEFEILAAKVLTREASIEEQARLRDLVLQNSDRDREFKELEAVWNSLCKAGPLLNAVPYSGSPIPRDRLLWLQDKVRKEFDFPTKADHLEQVPRDTDGTSSKRTFSEKARAFPQSVPRKSGVSHSANSMFKLWLRRQHRLVRAAAAVSLLLLALLALITLSRNHSSRSGDFVKESRDVLAYLLTSEGGFSVWRAGKELSTNVAIPLIGTDEVRLPVGTKAQLITAAGALEVLGPRRFQVREEIGGGAGKGSRNGAAQSESGRVGHSQVYNALKIALFKPAGDLLASAFLVTTRSGQSISVYSPLGSTTNLKPLILWKSEPGKTYDLTITDEYDPKTKPLRLAGTIPPVDFSKVAAWKGRTLSTNGLYRIVVMESGLPFSASKYTFRTLGGARGPGPITPSARLVDACQILSTEPARVGDALADLLTLPSDYAETELVLRLELFAFGRLGYHDDFAAVAASLNRKIGAR